MFCVQEVFLGLIKLLSQTATKTAVRAHLVQDASEQVQGQTLHGVGEQLDGKERGETFVGLPEHGSVASAVDEKGHGVVEELDRHSAVRVRRVCKSLGTRLDYVDFKPLSLQNSEQRKVSRVLTQKHHLGINTIKNKLHCELGLLV